MNTAIFVEKVVYKSGHYELRTRRNKTYTIWNTCQDRPAYGGNFFYHLKNAKDVVDRLASHSNCDHASPIGGTATEAKRAAAHRRTTVETETGNDGYRIVISSEFLGTKKIGPIEFWVDAHHSANVIRGLLGLKERNMAGEEL